MKPTDDSVASPLMTEGARSLLFGKTNGRAACTDAERPSFAMNATSACSSCHGPTTRRSWIQRLVISSAGCTALSGWLGTLTANAGLLNLSERLRLDITAFPSLSLNSGSAIITYNGGVTKILINRESDTDFFAMDPTCTHLGCMVAPYSIATNTIVCPCHGSQFDMHGQRVGGPAVTGLLPYVTRFEGASTLNIEIAGFVHRIDQVALHSSSPGSSRIRVQFPTMPNCQYQVRWSPDLTSPFTETQFSTTAAGMADQSILAGNGSVVSAYVDTTGDVGFFTLDLLVFQLA